MAANCFLNSSIIIVSIPQADHEAAEPLRRVSYHNFTDVYNASADLPAPRFWLQKTN